jgi:HD-GYP domain-containing protein (c-di-GMP phosphodiesterase class II)
MSQEAAGLELAFVSTVEALANALEATDALTSSHARAVKDLELAALLHDIGKIGIPSQILTKASALTDDERRLVEQHPQIGERIVQPIERLTAVRPIVRHCHERWDGAGYPDRLAGNDIPLEARIIFVADSYHAMTNDRPYAAAVTPEAARVHLRSESGTQFDPTIVAAFLGLACEGVVEDDLAALATRF